MIFSLEFLLGFLLFALVYNQLGQRLQNYSLLLFNITILACANAYALGIVLIYALLIHYCALLIHTRASGWIYRACIVAALAFLGLFKYYSELKMLAFKFFGASFNLELIFATGLSFYCFASISYLAQVYHRRVQVASFVCLLTYLSFFATFLAGPIFRYERFISAYFQLKRFYHFRLISALVLIALAKKLALAPMAYGFFESALNESSYLSLINASLIYCFYLFLDFSSYSELAISLALMLGIKLPRNFAYALSARNISDFWRRWHMSLSFFIRDFIYIPLGGSRCSKPRWMMAVIISFVLSGIWHGAGINYALWGLAHALGLIICAMFKPRLPYVIASLITFIYISLCWSLFYQDLDSLIAYFKQPLNKPNINEYLTLVIIFIIFSAYGAARGLIYRFAKLFKSPLLALIISIIWLQVVLYFMPSGVPNFVYASF